MMTERLNKQDRLTVYVEDLTHDGSGVAKIDGYPLFIPDVLPEEEAGIEITKLNKKYGFAKLIEVTKPSPNRVNPPCHVFWTCGGCQLQHLSYEGQLERKRKMVRDVMDRIAKLPHVPVHPVMGMDIHVMDIAVAHIFLADPALHGNFRHNCSGASAINSCFSLSQ